MLADGKLYVGTENGKFFILKPSAKGCEILDEDQLGTEAVPEKIIGSVAISDGRVYMVSEAGLYCIGKKNRITESKKTALAPDEMPEATGPATWVQVVPTELMLKPGDKVNFRARLFNAQGQFAREEPAATGSLDNSKAQSQTVS